MFKLTVSSVRLSEGGNCDILYVKQTLCWLRKIWLLIIKDWVFELNVKQFRNDQPNFKKCITIKMKIS